jgi:hypothetical protein
MRKMISAGSALALLAMPAMAGAQTRSDRQEKSDRDDKAEKPVTQKEPTATDVVATPATDLNLKKNEIPPLLLAAEQRPYVLRGLDTCRQLAAAIGELDGVLGDDIDVPQSEGKRMSAGRVAQSVVGAFIPFRGVIREISGANAQDRAMQAAILAGVARRSFLKGIGQGKGCRYPARSATLDVFNYRMAAINAGEEPWKPSPEAAEPAPAPRVSRGGERRAVRYVSRPVVQRAD